MVKIVVYNFELYCFSLCICLRHGVMNKPSVFKWAWCVCSVQWVSRVWHRCVCSVQWVSRVWHRCVCNIQWVYRVWHRCVCNVQWVSRVWHRCVCNVQWVTGCVCVSRVCLWYTEIASAADEFQKSLLTSDADCSYDSLVEIDLDTVGLLLICLMEIGLYIFIIVNHFSYETYAVIFSELDL